MCWQHTRAATGLYVARSTLANAGDGLFTRRAIRSKELIAPYGGRIMRQAAYFALPPDEQQYGVALRGDSIMDGRSTQSSLARWANTRAGRTNAWFAVTPNTASLRASRPIAANSEIFAAYGPGFRIPR